MQTSQSHVVPAYVANAFNLVQRDHLMDQPNDELDDILRSLADERKQVIVVGGSHTRLVGAPRQTTREIIRQSRIRAQVQADLDRIYGPDFNEELEKEMSATQLTTVESKQSLHNLLPELIDGLSTPRVVAVLKTEPRKLHVFSQGVWEPLKPMVGVKIHHELPEDLKDAVVANSSFSEEFELLKNKDKAYKVLPKFVDKSITDWLAIVNESSPRDAQRECESLFGIETIGAIRRYLFETDDYHPSPLRHDVAAELESFGYLVSYDYEAGVLLLVMKSGTIRWEAI